MGGDVAIEVGHRFAPREVLIDATRIEEFVTAIGVEPEPGYRAVDGAPVPAGFLMYVTTYGPQVVHDALGVDPLRTVFGGSTVDVAAPVRVGDTLTVEPHLSDVTIKTGSRGTLRIFEITCEYRDRTGTVAVRERSTVIERGAA